MATDKEMRDDLNKVSSAISTKNISSTSKAKTSSVDLISAWPNLISLFNKIIDSKSNKSSSILINSTVNGVELKSNGDGSKYLNDKGLYDEIEGGSGSIAHNDTTGKQGGTSEEYYHITESKNNALAGTSGTPSASNPYVTNSDSRNTDARTPLSHNHSASDINSGTLDGDRLPAISTSKKGAVPATGTPSDKFLKDDGTWSDAPGGSGLTFPQVYAINSLRI